MSKPRTIARILLGSALTIAGLSHLTTKREEFRAQVPDFVPLHPDTTVVASGVAEIGLGKALLFAPKKCRRSVGWIAAIFFVAIFPGNLSQWIHQRDGFGLDTDAKRFGRLFFQPALIAWALFATGRSRRS
ncbi:DoxX family protein [Microbacterium amylolyticum]|uniref:Membrane protein n=1 Tax=Microbacterium amylolyticum TaxID=936337 RepID=A0ABS4ZF40_9MICO|nr:DoxX family membrane protein [Microbacterium amylolyticum]MBP2435879.1 putative membrane protein [Microbacterium amylolyticum]